MKETWVPMVFQGAKPQKTNSATGKIPSLCIHEFIIASKTSTIILGAWGCGAFGCVTRYRMASESTLAVEVFIGDPPNEK